MMMEAIQSPVPFTEFKELEAVKESGERLLTLTAQSLDRKNLLAKTHLIGWEDAVSYSTLQRKKPPIQGNRRFLIS